MPPRAAGAPAETGPGHPGPGTPGGEDPAAHYDRCRRPLLLQTYVLTGDLELARGAVVDAFTEARRRWAEVSGTGDPEGWVRRRAWALAHRRQRLRPRGPGREAGAEQRPVLDALGDLSGSRRRVLVLSALAGLDPEAVGREVGLDATRARDVLEQSRSALARGLGDDGSDPARLDARLHDLAAVTDAAVLPRSGSLEHQGRRRRRRQRGLVALVVALGLCLVGGVLALGTRGGAEDRTGAAAAGVRRDDGSTGDSGSTGGSGASGDATASTASGTVDEDAGSTGATGSTGDDGTSAGVPVSPDLLLDLAQVQRIVASQRARSWRVTSTDDNTGGDGINSICQDQRFADPDGAGTLVRRFVQPGSPRRTLVQTVEVSTSPSEAATAYQTTLDWYAGCRQARLQLLSAYRLPGLADQGELVVLRVPRKVRRTFVVAVVRSGSLTVSTVLQTVNGPPLDLRRTRALLTGAMVNLCPADAAGGCPAAVRVTPVLPPPSGRYPGTLTEADLPAVGRVDKPWVGTGPTRARPNVAATPCDDADFVAAGARRPTTRTFLIPQARLPRRFGIAETLGVFPARRQAVALVREVRTAMAACEKKDLGAQVSQGLSRPRAFDGSEFHLWRVDSEIGKGRTIGFWTGVVRVGRRVAQVTFTPAPGADVDAGTFQALVVRARNRLFELTGNRP